MPKMDNWHIRCLRYQRNVIRRPPTTSSSSSSAPHRREVRQQTGRWRRQETAPRQPPSSMPWSSNSGRSSSMRGWARGSPSAAAAVVWQGRIRQIQACSSRHRRSLSSSSVGWSRLVVSGRNTSGMRVGGRYHEGRGGGLVLHRCDGVGVVSNRWC